MTALPEKSAMRKKTVLLVESVVVIYATPLFLRKAFGAVAHLADVLQ